MVSTATVLGSAESLILVCLVRAVAFDSIVIVILNLRIISLQLFVFALMSPFMSLNGPHRVS